MEVMIVAAVLGAIVLVVWLSRKLNAYSIEEYGYQPIGFATIFLAMIPYVLIVAGVIFKDNDPANMEWAVTFAVMSVIGIFKWIARHSDSKVALGATVLLLITGLPALLLLISLMSRDGDNYYYYDD